MSWLMELYEMSNDSLVQDITIKFELDVRQRNQQVRNAIKETIFNNLMQVKSSICQSLIYLNNK